MHLTRLRLDPRHALARRDLADPYDMHRTLVRAFVEDAQQPPPRFLWRLEPGAGWTEAVVLLQSPVAGQWDFLQSTDGYLQPGPESLAQGHFDSAPLVKAGRRLRFRLAGNPTVTRAGKRWGLVGESDQIAWLVRQGQRQGFELHDALVRGSRMLQARKQGMRLSLRQVLFEGVLVVHEPLALAAAVANGIGHGKALGCGLLSLGAMP